MMKSTNVLNPWQAQKLRLSSQVKHSLGTAYHKTK